MRFLTILGLALPLITGVSSECTDPKVRREWRTLSTDERCQYIEAIKCLMENPPQSSKEDLPGAMSRFDDFLGTHIVQADDVHFVGVFYPYHRLMLHVWEEEIQTCGWEGGIPYWDWVIDAKNFVNSPVFDTKVGFGGNGDYIPGNFTHPHPDLIVNTPWDVPDHSGGGCLETGPFAGLQTSMGPENGTALNPHCVRRDFSPFSFFNMSGPAAVEKGLSQPDHGSFDKLTESTFHSGGHWGVGGLYGTMTDKWASPADPIFYIHHANLDRAWWSWQNKDLANREKDISGPLVAFDWTNEKGGNVTLNYDISFGQTVKTTAKVKEMMHIQKGDLCYTYDKLY